MRVTKGQDCAVQDIRAHINLLRARLLAGGLFVVCRGIVRLAFGIYSVILAPLDGESIDFTATWSCVRCHGGSGQVGVEWLQIVRGCLGSGLILSRFLGSGKQISSCLGSGQRRRQRWRTLLWGCRGTCGSRGRWRDIVFPLLHWDLYRPRQPTWAGVALCPALADRGGGHLWCTFC